MSVCIVTNAGAGYSITTLAAPFTASVIGTGSTAALGDCIYDFLTITGARDANGGEADRYCGNALNPAVGTATNPGSANSIQVCSKFFTI
jgi:hypothetical protein